MPNAPHRFDRAGLSVPAFAEATGLNEAQVRKAISLGQIKRVDFAGMKRIPYTEAIRVANLLGIDLHETPSTRGKLGKPHIQRDFLYLASQKPQDEPFNDKPFEEAAE